MKIKKKLLSTLFLCMILLTSCLIGLKNTEAIEVNAGTFNHYVGGKPVYEGTFTDGTPYTLTTRIVKLEEDDSIPSEVEVIEIEVADKDLDLSDKKLILPSDFQEEGHSYVIKTIYSIRELNNLNLILPETIESLSGNCFFRLTNLNVYFPASLKNIGGGIFSGSTINKITISKNNTSFKLEKGELYSYDGKTAYLLKISAQDTLIVKEGVEKIIEGAIPMTATITKAVFPKTIKRINSYLDQIAYIEFKGTNPPILGHHLVSPYVKVPKNSLSKYLKAKTNNRELTLVDLSDKGQLAFNDLKTFDQNKYYYSAAKYLKSISTEKNLKAALVKPKDLTDKQWKEIKKKAASITKGAKNDREKAKRIYEWIVKESYYNYDGAGGANSMYLFIRAEKYDLHADKTYSAFKNRKMIDYGFANLTVAMMRAAGLPCETILPDGINQYWQTHFSSYSNIVYYNNEWHIVNAAKDCKNGIYDGELVKSRDYNEQTSPVMTYFEYDLQVYTFIEQVRPAIDTAAIPEFLLKKR